MNKPFKMKGHTLPGINQRSEGNTDLPDGRSGSSPFQHTRYFGQNTTVAEMNAVTSNNQAHQKEAAKEKKSKKTNI